MSDPDPRPLADVIDLAEYRRRRAFRRELLEAPLFGHVWVTPETIDEFLEMLKDPKAP